MENYAGVLGKDKEIGDELRIAKIKVNNFELFKNIGEVK